MLSKEIETFKDLRYEVRAYAAYLFLRNIKNHLPVVELSKIHEGLQKIFKEIGSVDAAYILDSHGTQVIETITGHVQNPSARGKNFNHRAYFYRAIEERKCILTDPYPTRNDGNLVVTAAYPIYNEAHELQYVACLDFELPQAIRLAQPTTLSVGFEHFSKLMYGALSLLLLAVAFLLLVRGVLSILHGIQHFNTLDIKEIFEATILLTLSLAIYDLVKTLFGQEVLGRGVSHDHKMAHQTMIRFLGSIIIALAIEALMLVFKFTITEPDKIVYAIYLIGGVALLLVGLAIYIYFVYSIKEKAD
ncbi:MAG: PDC sensor domain-containing protein [Helicobacter sp.]|nr:PDC sensor domain-containing protein [Helicobacter sp.]